MSVPRLSAGKIALRCVEFVGLVCLMLAATTLVSGLLMSRVRRGAGGGSVGGLADSASVPQSPPDSALATNAGGAAVAAPLEMAADNPWLIPVYLVSLIAALVATRVVARHDRLTWSDVGLRRAHAGGDLAIGLLTGLANFALVPTIARSLGWATIEAAPAGGAPIASLARALPLLAFAAAFEEVALRGIVLALIAARSTPLAVLLTSALFAALHLANPGANAIAALGVFVPGVVLAFARFRSAALWVPIGWHIGWNLGQGWLFGCAVSGMPAAASPVVVARFDGPAAAVGGTFGPESGLIAVGSYVATCLAYVALVRPRRADAAA
jgi:membrane protease YdiL (CAAX protease family)